MSHTLKISVSPGKQDEGIVSCRHITVREKLIRFLLGDKRQLTIIVPGSSVKTMSIVEEGGESGEQNQTVT